MPPSSRIQILKKAAEKKRCDQNNQSDKLNHINFFQVVTVFVLQGKWAY